MDPRTPTSFRIATSADVPHLVAMNHAAYPDLVEDGVVWSAEQLQQHQARFARGQIVAEVDGAVAGAISTLILPTAIDVLAPHTWVGVTDAGTFARHDEGGETLYLADVYVHPAHWGRGVGRELYERLWALCRESGCARVVAGGRLWGYGEVAHRMTAHEYVKRVVAGALRDRVLGSQLRAGFELRGLLPNYLHDYRSRSWATLLEWRNPLSLQQPPGATRCPPPCEDVRSMPDPRGRTATEMDA